MTFRLKRCGLAWPIALLAVSAFAPAARAQNPPAQNLPAPDGATLADRLSSDVNARLQQGRELLDAGDASSAPVLRAAAQGALQVLQSVEPAAQDVLTAPPGSLPSDPISSVLAARAARAHLLWGIAAQRFARRDEAITALARAQRLAQAPSDARESDLKRDINLELGKVLGDGLPLIAPGDVLGDIASLVHGDAWTPRAFDFDGKEATGNADFLLTDGSLFPPPPQIGGDIAPRTPSFYRLLDKEQLPVSLKLNKMVAGYAREKSGPNQGQWRQKVRVFYASERLTKERRADFPRASDLAQQFLRVQALFGDELGLSNLYAQDDRDAGVTTLWLLEVSALWPNDDTDPRVLAQLGPNMPKVNTGPSSLVPQPETTALMRPWMPLAINDERAPGEILLWKAGLDRSQAEWLRELFHEYGHVAFPPLGGIRAPLEPFANGVIGETLGLMWAARTPAAFATPDEDAATLNAAFDKHLRAYALPARALFVSAGPNSTLSNAGDAQSLRYLNGATTYLERVYGGALLGRALQPLATRASQTQSVAARRGLLKTADLFASIETNWAAPWDADNAVPIWLPGALDVELDAPTLVNRAAYTLRAGTRAPLVLWVPPGTSELKIEGAGAGSLSVIGAPFGGKGDVLRVFFGANGWQKATLVAKSEATIGAARFVRK